MSEGRTDTQGLLDMLFEQMGRLEQADAEHVATEVERSRSMAGLAKEVNATYANVIKVAQLKGSTGVRVPEIEGGSDA